MPESMTYEEALAYIHSITWRGSRPGLSRTLELLRRMGNPQDRLKFVHVAGTNGKGSTCRMLSCILEEAGMKTGLYTSPYIIRFNERMQINGVSIRDDVLADITAYVKTFADDMEDPPTEFELITAMSFEWFYRERVDVVVLEVGLGGELDSTNVIAPPLAAVITAMGYDHTKILGNTMQQIASAKAGIIKPGTRVVSYGGNPEADAVIHARCERYGVPCTEVNDALIDSGEYSLDGQHFSYRDRKDLVIRLLGTYQLRNAALVLDTVDTLRSLGIAISEEAIRAGLCKATWPARFEVVHRDPVFIVDGGHNPHGVRATIDTFERLFPGRKAVFICGFMADKDIDEILTILRPCIAHCYCVRPDNPRAMAAQDLAEKMKVFGIDAEAAGDIPSAVTMAIVRAGKDGICCASGSLYMSGDMRRAVAAYYAGAAMAGC